MTTQVLQDQTLTGRERPWAVHKRMNLLLGAAYLDVDEEKAKRLRSCATQLSFELHPEGKKLRTANFCRVRLCPMCTWRRSLKVGAQMHRIMAAIKADKPISYIMLTLTMRNCKPEDLGAELDRLGIAFNKLTKAKQYQEAIKGFYRAVEVTHNVEEGTFHPHIHAVLAVNPSYFTHRTYISQEGWTKLWRQTLRVDYDPIVHVQKVKGNTAKAIAEIAKYGLKTTDYILPDDWDLTVDTVYLLDKVLAYRRFVGFGGIFRDYHKKLNLDDAEEGDLVDLDGDGFVDSRASADSMLVHYAWFSGYRQYMQVEI